MRKAATAGVALLLALAIIGFAANQAGAWEQMTCRSQGSTGVLNYPDGDAWPFHTSVSLESAPAWTREAFGKAMDTWNAVLGARDELRIDGSGFAGCYPSRGMGYGVVGWDDGSCIDWPMGALGATTVDGRRCVVDTAAMFFNANAGMNAGWLQYAATHELGHYQLYEHNWYEVSIMGYVGSPFPMLFLPATDHDFLRTVFPTGETVPPDLAIHTFMLADPIVPDQVSLVMTPAPQCTGYCSQLVPGEQIIATVTYENAGGQDAKDADITMYFVDKAGQEFLLGSWTVEDLPAGTSRTAEFMAIVPAGAPAGDLELTVWINHDLKIAEQDGPSAGNMVKYTGFRIAPPPSWTCDPAAFNNGKLCDCNCGALDPDCHDESLPVNGCFDGIKCTADRCDGSGVCVYEPQDGSCDDWKYCTVDDQCTDGSCAGTPRDCSSEDAPCKKGRCNESLSACEAESLPDGTSCADPALSGASHCQEGACVAGEAAGAGETAGGKGGPASDGCGCRVSGHRGEALLCLLLWLGLVARPWKRRRQK